jgi:hypothetical protein
LIQVKNLFYKSPKAFKKPVKDITIPPITQTFFRPSPWTKRPSPAVVPKQQIIGHVSNGFLLV